MAGSSRRTRTPEERTSGEGLRGDNRADSANTASRLVFALGKIYMPTFGLHLKITGVVSFIYLQKTFFERIFFTSTSV